MEYTDGTTNENNIPPSQPLDTSERKNDATAAGDRGTGDNTGTFSDDTTPYTSAQLEITNTPPLTGRQTPPSSHDNVNKSAGEADNTSDNVTLTKETPDKSDALYLEKSPSSREDIENAIVNEENVGEDDNLPDSNRSDVPESILPKRYVLLLMIFLGFAVVYSLRVNINVAIVAMVNNRTRITKDGKIAVYVSNFSYFFCCVSFIVDSP